MRWLFLLSLAGDRKLELLPEHEGDENVAVFSPDSRWVAYQVFTSGAPTVFVAPVGGGGGKWQVSTTGGYVPRWRGDGKELYFITPRDLTMMAAKVEGSGPEFHVGEVTPLFPTRASSNPDYAYDVSADGQRFLINSVETDASAPVTLVLNWPAGMKK